MVTNQRLSYIDKLRGVAIISVMIYHIWGYSLPFSDYIDLGILGVDLFFWISGYIIMVSIQEKHYNVSKFIIARFFRLYPLYWCSILLYLYLYQGTEYATILTNFTMLQRILGRHDLIPVYWTLSVELMFYIYVIFCIKTRTVNLGESYLYGLIGSSGLALIMAIIRFIIHKKIPVIPFAALAIIFNGALLFQHKTKGFLSKKLIQFILLSNLIIFILIISVLSKCSNWPQAPFKFVSMYIVAGLFFLYVTNHEKFLNKNIILDFFGKISYPVYLFHFLIYTYLKNLLSLHFNQLEISLIVTILTIMVGFILHHLVEKRLIQVGKSYVK